MMDSATKVTLPSNLPIVPIKFNNKNYYLWHNIMISFLTGYDMLEYAEDSIPQPPKKIVSTEGDQKKKKSSIPNISSGSSKIDLLLPVF